MKKILIFLIVLLIPIIANAKLDELILVDQYNTGYSDAYFTGDYFVLLDAIYEENSNKIFAAMDMKGNFIYEVEFPEEYIISYKFFDGDYIYLMYGVYLGNLYDLHIERYNPKTGEKINDLIFNDITSIQLGYLIYQDFGDTIGIRLGSTNMTYYQVEKDLSSYEQVNYFHTGDQPIPTPPIEYITGEEKQNFIDYMHSNNIEYNDYSQNIIKYDGQYYTFTYNLDGRISNILYADYDLTEYDVVSINNDKLYDGSKFGNNPNIIRSDTLNILHIIPYKDKLVVVFNYSIGCLLAFDPSNRFGGNCLDDVYVQIYKMTYTVSTKTDGHGTIKVSKEEAKKQEEITFEIIPDKGYVLGELKVTDSNGKTVTFTDNKFTMPNSNVLIEATFVLAETGPNPNTKDAILITIMLLTLSLFTLVMYNTNKKKLT